jgi:hypothetical protein
MEVCSSNEMGAPGASHLGTGDHGPKTDRNRPRSVPVNAPAVTDQSLARSRLMGTNACEKLRPPLPSGRGELEQIQFCLAICQSTQRSVI